MALSGQTRGSAFGAVVILTFGLAVGVNIAVLSLVSAIWLEPRPVRSPETVAVVYSAIGASSAGEMTDAMSYSNAERLRSIRDTGVAFELSGVGLMGDWRPQIRPATDGIPFTASAVSHDYFDVLGVPLLGSGFRPDDDAPPSDAIAIISRRLSRALFGDTGAVGRAIATTRGPLTVVGVVQSRFRGPRLGDHYDVWLPLGGLGRFADVARNPGITRLMPLTAFCRLPSPSALAATETRVRGVLGPHVSLAPLASTFGHRRSPRALASQRRLLSALLLVAGLIAIIGAGNLVVLFLFRVEDQSHALAIRLAMGASRAAVTKALLLPLLFVAGVGLVVAVGVAFLLTRAVATTALPTGLRVADALAGVHWRAFLAGGVIAAGAALPACAAALRRTWDIDISSVLARPDGDQSRRAVASHRAFLACHTLLATALLAIGLGATIAIHRAFADLAGFDAAHTAFVALQPRLAQYSTGHSDLDTARRADDFATLLAALRGLPGVTSAVVGAPLVGRTASPAPDLLVVADDHVHHVPAVVRSAGPGYLTTMGVRILEGRDIGALDRGRDVDVNALLRDPAMAARFQVSAGNAPPAPLGLAQRPVAVIDATLARTLWPGRSALGRRFSCGFLNIEYEVVGVSAPLPLLGTATSSTATVITLSSEQSLLSTPAVDIVLRTTRDASLALGTFRTLVTRTFTDPVRIEIYTGTDIIASRTARRRLVANLIEIFAAVAVALTVVGVVGLVGYLVALRRRECAIRSMLGAPVGSIRRMIIRRSLVPIVIGVIAAGPCSVAAAVVVNRLVGLFDSGVAFYYFGGALITVAAALLTAVAATAAQVLDIGHVGGSTGSIFS
jgi:ABC-type antimicrobial peptide transport system permease subunit